MGIDVVKNGKRIDGNSGSTVSQRNNFKGRVVAVSGCDLDPVVCSIARDCLEALGRPVEVCACEDEASVAQALRRAVERDADFVFAWMDIANPCDIEALGWILQPDIAIVMQCASCSAAMGDSMHARESTCAGIFHGMRKAGMVFLPACDASISALAQKVHDAGRGLFAYAYDGSGAEPSQCTAFRPGLYARSIEADEQGRVAFDICSELFDRFESYSCRFDASVCNSVTQAVAAAAACIACGVRLCDFATAFNSLDTRASL